MATALVTGGSRGIGRAVCLAFARAGYDIAFCWSRDEKGAEETLSLLSETGAGAQAFRCDVSDEACVRDMFRSVLGLKVLVNNAGTALFREIGDTSYGEWRRVFDVNCGGAFLCTREAVPKLRGRGGAVINISSVWGVCGASCESAYAASKAALIGFTKSAAKELGPAGIRVNCIVPGFVDTEMNARLSAEERREFLRTLPISRAGEPEEIAAAALFLAEQPYITGEIFPVAGGML